MDGRGDPRRTWCEWEGGPHAVLYLLWCWFLNVILPFFFFTIAQKFTCHFPQLKEKVFLEFISLKENNV
ncbi:unnamed protein product [Staurois parvus]|uniref:Uncharacterized protein n=1 Tax=Staurois parvus TaxID=386267 RepID=A0ABN9ABV4_9NEOB|nr:unnamed protein product [Staurois parvus]